MALLSLLVISVLLTVLTPVLAQLIPLVMSGVIISGVLLWFLRQRY